LTKVTYDNPILLNMETIIDWHKRYQVQAGWTRDLRSFLYQQIPNANRNKIIEVGCGTGVIARELCETLSGHTTAIDIDFQASVHAHSYTPESDICVADGVSLPFFNDSFDLSVCHFYLLWFDEPIFALSEMKRVTRKSGSVIALAEPDYGGRIDYPPDFEHLARYQTQALLNQGANPFLGRQLSSLFHQVGLSKVVMGILGGQWSYPASIEDFESEWSTLQFDLADYLSPTDLEAFRAHDKIAREEGRRILYVPTFYAMGSVP
jgi:ubiquinone/menaquinone biosynthesis C-methylase UbiE